MRKRILLLLPLLASCSLLFAQTGNVGAGTTAPGSRLTVNGSMAGKYRIETNTTANIGANDFYVAYGGTDDGTLTLPAAMPGSGNFLGRIYHIKNTSDSTLIVAASGAELINNQTATGVANITLAAGQYVALISKGTTTGTTWEVAITGFGKDAPGASITSQSRAYVRPEGSAATNTFQAIATDPLQVISTFRSITLPADKSVFFNYMFGGIDVNTTTPPATQPYYRFEIYVDDEPSGIFSIIQIKPGTQFQFTLSGTLNITAGEHGIYVAVQRWYNNGLGDSDVQSFRVISSVFESNYLN